MGYGLGVDLGTTFTAAAVVRDGRVAALSLGQRATAVPTVVHVDADGAVLVGDAAVRRAVEEPGRVAREVKRRIGDPVPVLLGGSPWAPEALHVEVLRWVVDRVSSEEGSPPDRIVVTHPANWGAFKLDLVAQAVRHAGLDHVVLRPEPVAAAAWYANEHRLGDGEVVAVYDLGGGTFDAAVVRRVGTGFELLGRPDGIERLGGIDFDAAVLDHVTSSAGVSLADLDPDDPEVLADVADLRARSVEAKEALSVDTTTSIPVRLPGTRMTVRLTRAELEEAIRRPLAETVVALRRTLGSAGVAPTDLRAVLLVGGSSRIPLVSELVSGALGVPVAVDADPKLAVALGAALLASEPGASGPPAPSPPEPALRAPEPVPPSPGRRRRPVVAGVAVVVVLGVVALGAALAGGDDGGEDLGVEGGGGELPVGDGVLRIGVLLPGGDSDEAILAGVRVGAELAVEDLNAAGGVLGSDVELVVADSGEPGSGAVSEAMDELLDADVDLVIGPPDPLDASMVRRAVDEGIAGCSAIDSDADSLDEDDGRFVQTTPNQFLQAAAVAEAVIDDGHGTVAIVAPDDVATFRDAVVAAFEERGISPEPVIGYERGSLEVVELTSELNNGPGSTTVLLGDVALAGIVVEGASQGYLGPFFGDEVMTQEAFGRRVAPMAGASAVLPVTVDPAPSGSDDSVASRAADRLGTVPLGATYAYDCVLLAALAAAANDSDHPDALVAGLADASAGGETCLLVECLELAADGVDVDYDGASGPVDLDDDGDVTSGVYIRWRWDATGAIQPEDTIEI